MHNSRKRSNFFCGSLDHREVRLCMLQCHFRSGVIKCDCLPALASHSVTFLSDSAQIALLHSAGEYSGVQSADLSQ